MREGTVWEQCSSKVFYDQQDLLRPMMPYYQRLLTNYDINVLVFSGVSVFAIQHLYRVYTHQCMYINTCSWYERFNRVGSIFSAKLSVSFLAYGVEM